MSNKVNELERRAARDRLVERYLKLDAIGDSRRLVDFVLRDCRFLDQENKRDLAYSTIAAEFVAMFGRGDKRVSIEKQTEIYCELFESRSLKLDRAELLKRLIQCELYHDENSPLFQASRDDLKKRFPSIAPFFDDFFERRRLGVFSRNSARFSATARETSPPIRRLAISEEYAVSFRPIENDETLGKLGSGGLKDVYLARQNSTNQAVALKILRDRSKEARELFKSEALVQARLAHPNIPQVLSYDENAAAPTLIERYILGKSWAELWDEQTLEEKLDVLATVSRVVAYAHKRQRVIHCDLKPENVMLGESGGRYNEVYVVDWGLALCLDDEGAARKKINGTPDYQPPETFPESNYELSFATDVFMLGGILYRILCGSAPYRSGVGRRQDRQIDYSPFQTTTNAIECVIPPIPERNPTTDAVNSPELCEIANKALRPNPKERYADAAKFGDALERYRRRVGLDERLRAAQEAFARILQHVENKDVPLLTLIETTNEFRLLREETARSDADGPPSNLFWRAVESERRARDLLINRALKSQDFSVVETQIETAERLETTVAPLVPASNGVATSPAPLDDYRANLREARERREREERAERELVQLQARRLAEQKIAKTREIEQAVAPLVAERWRQGEVALRASVDEPELTATALHLAERSGLFLETVGPRRVALESIAFSADEKYIATFGPVVGTTVYRAPNKEKTLDADFFASVARFPFPNENYNGKRFLLANPAFVAETASAPELASRFLLCRDDGVVSFLRFDESGATSTHKVDFRSFEAPQNRVPWGTPSFATTAAHETRLLVADASGSASLYSFPDGRLLKTIRLCAPFDGVAVPIFIATPDGRTFFSAGLDGSFKRWSSDGEELETLDLPLNSEVDWESYAWLPRVLETSPDGRTLYASDESGKFVVWDVAAKTPIYVGQEPSDPASETRLDFGENKYISRVYRLDANRFLTLAANGPWRVWDLSRRDENGVPINVELRDELSETERVVIAADISPSRRTLAVGVWPSFQFLLYDLDAGAPVAVSEGRVCLQTGGLTLSAAARLPQSDRVLVGSDNWSQIVAVDLRAFRVATEYRPHPDDDSRLLALPLNGVPCDFAVPEVGGKFAVAFTFGDVLFFQDGVAEPTGKLLGAFPRAEVGPSEALTRTLSFLSEAEKRPELWEEPNVLDDPNVADALLNGNQTATDNFPLLAASPDGSRLIGKTACGDEFVLWDWKTRRKIKSWRVFQGDVLTREEFVAALKAEPSALFSLSAVVNPQKLTLGLAFLDASVVLEIKCDGSFVRFDVDAGKRVASTPFGRPTAISEETSILYRARSWRLSTDRKRLALGFHDGLIAVVEVETGRTLLTTAEFAKRLPNRFDVSDRPRIFDFSVAATGFAWSRDDSLLCATFGNGRAVLLETSGFTPLETFVVGESGRELEELLNVFPAFTRDDKLATLDSRGFMKRWDFRPSPEKATVLDACGGSSFLSGASRPNVWASVSFKSRSNAFVVKEGDRELYRRPDVQGFARLTEPGATRETFLLLGLDGFLSAVDETGAPFENGVAWNRGVPGATAEATSAQADEASIVGASPPERLAERPSNERTLEFSAEIDACRELSATSAQTWDLFFQEIGGAPLDFVARAAVSGSAGFIGVASAPNRRAFAAIGKSDGGLYVLTSAEAEAGWRLIVLPEIPQKPFVRLAFRPDSRELAAATSDGGVVFATFDAAPDGSGGVVWSRKTFQASGRGALNAGALVYSPSGRFLFQTGTGACVYVWDVETREPTQLVALDLYDRALGDPESISALVPLRFNGSTFSSSSASAADDSDSGVADAFAVAASDGVLRFYRRDAATARFAPFYLISPKTLSELIESASSLAKRAERVRVGADVRSLFWRASRRLRSLAVSDDGGTLYVGSFSDVCSYDLEEIGRAVAALPEYWRAFDVEGATGLRYSPCVGLCCVERDRLIPVDRRRGER